VGPKPSAQISPQLRPRFTNSNDQTEPRFLLPIGPEVGTQVDPGNFFYFQTSKIYFLVPKHDAGIQAMAPKCDVGIQAMAPKRDVGIQAMAPKCDVGTQAKLGCFVCLRKYGRDGQSPHLAVVEPNLKGGIAVGAR